MSLSEPEWTSWIGYPTVARWAHRYLRWIRLPLIFLACCLTPAEPMFLPNDSATSAFSHYPTWLQVGAVLSVAVLAAMTAWLAYRGGRKIRLLIAGALVAWLALSALGCVIVASYYAGVWFRGRRARIFVIVGVVLTAAPVAVNRILSFGDDGNGLVNAALNLVIVPALLLILPFTLGVRASASRELIARLRERTVWREREETAVAGAARAQERARIAREMHDVVAHRVSLMVLQAGALEVNTTDDATRQTAGLIRETGRAALTELRSALGVLRESREAGVLGPQPSIADVPELVAESVVAGLPVQYRVTGTVRPLAPVVSRAAYRVVREALTNIHKHAPDTARAAVEVRYGETWVEVAVRNTAPRSVNQPPLHSGYGLRGLDERVELVAGRLAYGPLMDGGFAVTARMPLAVGQGETS